MTRRSAWSTTIRPDGPGVLAEGHGWVRQWCLDHLGRRPAAVLFVRQQMSTVLGLRLTDGSEVVVKSRSDQARVQACVRAQLELAERGLPCPRPLTPAVSSNRLVVHAEEHWPGGEVIAGESAATAARYGEAFAEVVGALSNVTVPSPLPNPRWVRWDHAEPGLWPAISQLDQRDQRAVPPFLVEAAVRARRRLVATRLPRVLGHADFEAQNLRWRGSALWVVHDWDSLAWQPEAALVGAAGATFSRVAERPCPLPPVESSAAFVLAYQDGRGRALTAEEHEVAWAASSWVAAHHARWETLMGTTTPTADLRAQFAERLRRARA